MSDHLRRLDVMRMVRDIAATPEPVPAVDIDAAAVAATEKEAQWRRANLKRSLDNMSPDSDVSLGSSYSNMSCESPRLSSPPKRQRVGDDDDMDTADSTEPKLSAEQEEVVKLAMDGASFYVTGKAGTGKSFLLHAIAERLREKYYTTDPAECPVHVTATTGKVAGDLGGRTINNFMAIGTGGDTVANLVKKVKRAKKQCEVIQQARVIIIDEISMMSAEIMDNISEVLCKLMLLKLEQGGKRPRRSVQSSVSTAAFGGIQMIVCGDFGQLPPVGKSGQPKPQFCFKSKAWNRVFGTTRLLTYGFRQAGDPQYAQITDEGREGYLSAHSRSLLSTRQRHGVEPGPDKNGVIPTTFFPKRDAVHQMNNKHLAQLPGEMHQFQGKDWIRVNLGDRYKVQKLTAELDSICRAPKDLLLKMNAQVVLLKNIDQKKGMCNGLRGVVVGFEETDKGYPVVRFTNGIMCTITPHSWKIEEGYMLIATRTQLPLMLGWASTVHGGQGETCSLCALNFRGCFERGMAYVQLSRATSLAGMSLDYVPSNNELTPHPESAEFWARIVKAHDDRIGGKCVGPVYAVPQKRTGTLGDYFEQRGMTRSGSSISTGLNKSK